MRGVVLTYAPPNNGMHPTADTSSLTSYTKHQQGIINNKFLSYSQRPTMLITSGASSCAPDSARESAREIALAAAAGGAQDTWRGQGPFGFCGPIT